MSNKFTVLVGAGGINAKGRTSGNGGYLNHVQDCLKATERNWAEADLRALMGADDSQSYAELLTHTGVREFEASNFDYKNFKSNKKLTQQELNALPEEFRNQKLLKEITEQYPISFGGQLPKGFIPENFYNSRSHPKGLAMAVFAASEALMDTGIDIDVLRNAVPPNRMAVYAGSALGQLGQYGASNYSANRFRDERVSPRALAMALAQAPADFVNSYVFGSLGKTGHMMGACATLIYQVETAMNQIQANQIDLAIVGASEAPLNQDILDAFLAQSGAATDAKLMAIQKQTNQTTESILHHSACRPFADNIGVVLGESAQYFVLMSDDLAIKLGANIKSIIGAACVNADGFKAALPKPGAGNYLSLGYCLAGINKCYDQTNLDHTLVCAHGTGTPLNRTTESDVLSKVAAGFGIDNWRVFAPKSALGHSMASASGDGVAYSLGMFQHSIIPGINSIPFIADDVTTKNLQFMLQNTEQDPKSIEWSIINAKGFGGNNASMALSNNHVTDAILRQKHSAKELTKWQQKNEAVKNATQEYINQAHQGNYTVIYKFNQDVIDGETQINIADGVMSLTDTQNSYRTNIDLNDI